MHNSPKHHHSLHTLCSVGCFLAADSCNFCLSTYTVQSAGPALLVVHKCAQAYCSQSATPPHRMAAAAGLERRHQRVSTQTPGEGGGGRGVEVHDQGGRASARMASRQPSVIIPPLTPATTTSYPRVDPTGLAQSCKGVQRASRIFCLHAFRGDRAPLVLPTHGTSAASPGLDCPGSPPQRQSAPHYSGRHHPAAAPTPLRQPGQPMIPRKRAGRPHASMPQVARCCRPATPILSYSYSYAMHVGPAQ